MAGRPKGSTNKTTAEKVVENKIEIDTEKEDLKAQMAEMAEMLKQMKAQNALLQQQILTPSSSEKTLFGKKIRCINLANNPLNVTTEPDGKGKVYTFDKYGDSRLIKFDDVADIVASYPNTCEMGLFYIANKDAIKELGMEDVYENLLTQKQIDEMCYMRRESDVDIFIGLDSIVQKIWATKIADLLNKNEKIDYNFLRRIKDETEIDLEELAKDMKENPVIM